MVEVGFRKKLIIQLILVYKRLKPILEVQQSKDQIGFRSSVGVDDAFAVFENVCSKSMEWSVPMWCASLDKLKGCTNCWIRYWTGWARHLVALLLGALHWRCATW